MKKPKRQHETKCSMCSMSLYKKKENRQKQRRKSAQSLNKSNILSHRAMVLSRYKKRHTNLYTFNFSQTTKIHCGKCIIPYTHDSDKERKMKLTI